MRTKNTQHPPCGVTYCSRFSSESNKQLNSLSNRISYYQDFIKRNMARIFVPGCIDKGLSGAHSGIVDPEIREVSVEYRAEQEYNCVVMFADGGITTDAQFTLYDASSSKISWDHTERRYNGRLKIFNAHGSDSPYYINKYPMALSGLETAS